MLQLRELKEVMIFIVVDDLLVEVLVVTVVVDVEEEIVVLSVRSITGTIMMPQFVITGTLAPCLAMVTDLHNSHFLLTKPLSPILMALAINRDHSVLLHLKLCLLEGILALQISGGTLILVHLIMSRLKPQISLMLLLCLVLIRS
jgi:hypothetical protein